MSRVYSDTVLPEDSGVNQDFTFGTTNDVVQVTSGATLKVNTLKDSGGNTLFTSDGSGNLSSVNSGFQGKPTLITTNAVTGGSSSAFTTGIDSTYRVYIFKCYNINPSNDGTFFEFQVNVDGGSGYNETMMTTFFSAQHSEAGTDGALSYHAAYDQVSGTAYQYLSRMMGNGADEGGSGTLWLFNPSSTTYSTQFYSVWNGMYHADYSMNVFVSGYITTAAAIDEVDFKMSAGTFDGTIKMYGL